MSEPLDITPGLSIPIQEVVIRTSRSSGPGGQHANVTASRVEASLEIDASESLSEQQRQRLRERFGARVVATAQDTRSQMRNRELALQRLTERIADALRPQTPRRPSRPPKAAGERRLQSKRHRGQLKRGRRTHSHDDDN
jgi:ribosome-associated protein